MVVRVPVRVVMERRLRSIDPHSLEPLAVWIEHPRLPVRRFSHRYDRYDRRNDGESPGCSPVLEFVPLHDVKDASCAPRLSSIFVI